MNLRRNWRLYLLVLLVVLSTAAVFAPGVGAGSGSAPAAAATDPTNLQYGLDLSGGTRLRAPLVGTTAEGVDLGGADPSAVQATVVENLDGVTQSDVQVRQYPARQRGPTVEVFADVDREAFASALDAAGVSYDTIREGVTERTRSTAVAVIGRKIDASGLAGGTVQSSQTPTGEHFIVIEVPNRNASEVRDLVNERGAVEIVARFPGSNGTRNVTVLTQEDIRTVGTVQEPNQGIPQPHVPVTLTETGAEKFATAMQRFGFTSPAGTDSCRESLSPEQRYCIDTVLDGDVVYSASMSGGPDSLARTIESGDFEEDPTFVITAGNTSQARTLWLNLRAGALPAPLDLDSGTTTFVSPGLAENFKLYSLLTGLITVLAVAVVVFVRYRDRLVAAPMVVTALSEVVILLGLFAASGFALDLSHIAGFIAVIGTGVDDLVIIADEVMTEEVSSDRVFRNRFRKAFWVIGAAAITTGIAMGPLAILSLGDLRGFAIVTILGVLIGVLITRPAYGDILRNFLTGR